MFNVLYVTGSRADFGIMEPLLQQLNDSDAYNLDVVATGMQVENSYGHTVDFVREAGFNVIEEIGMNIRDTSAQTATKGLARLTAGLAEIFGNTHYDAVIILGDRYEMLAVANVATLYDVPIIHLHGGEQTLGNFDEAIRHAITKMATLHLTSTDEYQKRVIQMGENPNFVFNIGAMGVSNVLTEPQIDFETLRVRYGFDIQSDRYLVVLFHPETLLSENEIKSQVNELNLALRQIGMNVVLIGSNSDKGAMVIGDNLAQDDSSYKVFQISSLRPAEYHALVKNAYALVGNSSSGLIEVPSLHTPTINLGNRQEGRVAGPSVIQVPIISSDKIIAAIRQAREIENFDNPYFKLNSVESAFNLIDKYLKSKDRRKGRFFDISFSI
ncbi:MAG: UDP-N-acetylglucosamine 2-epimerase [Weissella confusa]